MDEISGTKELIFDTFIQLVSTLGYENVSMRNVAREVGINSASIYYYYESKIQILENVYDYYVSHMYDTRQPIEVMKKLVETAIADEIMNALIYTFDSDDKEKHTRMVLITKIVNMRLYQDKIANKIFNETILNNKEYVSNVLQHGIIVGRIDRGFDTEIFAEVLVGAIMFRGITSLAGSPDALGEVGQIEQEAKILNLFTRLLSTALIDKPLNNEVNMIRDFL